MRRRERAAVFLTQHVQRFLLKKRTLRFLLFLSLAGIYWLQSAPTYDLAGLATLSSNSLPVLLITFRVAVVILLLASITVAKGNGRCLPCSWAAVVIAWEASWSPQSQRGFRGYFTTLALNPTARQEVWDLACTSATCNQTGARGVSVPGCGDAGRRHAAHPRRWDQGLLADHLAVRGRGLPPVLLSCLSMRGGTKIRRWSCGGTGRARGSCTLCAQSRWNCILPSCLESTTKVFSSSACTRGRSWFIGNILPALVRGCVSSPLSPRYFLYQRWTMY